MKIKVDREKCVSSGQCAAFAPEFFDQGDEDGVVVLLHDSPAPELRHKARQAADLCPARAIAVEDEPLDHEPS
ncbi:MAG TPA: ferredoxin [Bosea sp. (in: a-proteobacteria)]|jgi:ferredoxin|nr:ferredoxin [Bosea sp. (in: a-proteobacteria)]